MNKALSPHGRWDLNFYFVFHYTDLRGTVHTTNIYTEISSTWHGVEYYSILGGVIAKQQKIKKLIALYKYERIWTGCRKKLYPLVL